MKFHRVADVRGEVLRAGDISEFAVLLLQHVVAALLHDAAFDRLPGVRSLICAALRGSLVLPDVSTGRSGSAVLVGGRARSSAVTGRATTRGSASTPTCAGAATATPCSAALGHSS
jgi:hypothetical protein